MTDPATRARQLIELACSSTHEEEARTSALAAARLIKKHDIELRDPGAGRSRAERGIPFDFEDALENLRRAAGGVNPFVDAVRQAARAPSRPPPARAPQTGAWMAAKMHLRCYDCSEVIERGERCYEASTSFGGRQYWCRRH